MYWAVITEADVLLHISGAELDALRAAALANGQVDPVQPSIDEVTDLVRGYVAACKENNLDATTTTIPERLISSACDMVVATIIGRVPGYDLDESRVMKYENSLKLMDKVSACKFAIQDPDSGEDQSGSVELVQSTTRQSTRQQLSGL